jgi:glycine cleavage system protein P-like pyridoxal-binding family
MTAFSNKVCVLASHTQSLEDYKSYTARLLEALTKIERKESFEKYQVEELIAPLKNIYKENKQLKKENEEFKRLLHTQMKRIEKLEGEHCELLEDQFALRVIR